MALPFQFANVTTLVTSQLDANYNALGALTPIPCTVAGTNNLVLTPFASVPTIAAYSNYMQFTGVAATNNTTGMTIQVGSLPALTAYKDTLNGPVGMITADLTAASAFIAIYDSALSLGAGGFHLVAESARMPTGGGAFIGPVQFGNIVNSALSNANSATATINWPNIPANSSTVSNVIVSGVSVGDCVFLGTPASVPAGITFFGWVPNAGTVTIQALNVTAASITPVAGTYRAVAQRYTP